MSRSNRWKQAGVGIALVVAVAAPGAFHAVRAAPEADRFKLPARVAAGKTFAPICKNNEIADLRPDPVWVGASFENDDCRAPRMPAPLNGYTATRGQIVAGMVAAKIYAAQADGFQKCVGNFLAARHARAGGEAKPSGSVLAMLESHRIAVSEKNKQRAAAQIEVAINAFNEYGSECPDR